MPQSYVSCLMHCIFSTKDRHNLLGPELRKRLYAYMGGIAREHAIKALAVGGTANHMHVLLSVPGTMPISKAMQTIKGGSSKWIHDTFPTYRGFAWQAGYGAFSIGRSQVPNTKRYIENQNEHHRHRTFQEEFQAFLDRYGVEYDARYIWG